MLIRFLNFCFIFKARENKFNVRDFVFNAEELQAGKDELTKLATDKKRQFGPLVRWLKVNFSECFMAWIHVKALRVFVESVLRYGLPVNFQGMVLLPQKKTQKKLRDTLNQTYAHLDSAGGSGDVSEYKKYILLVDLTTSCKIDKGVSSKPSGKDKVAPIFCFLS